MTTTGRIVGYVRTHRRHLVVLLILTCTYMINQLDVCDAPTYEACTWYYTGLGWEYQLLAGPIYIILFSISGIPLGLASELNNISRRLLLGICCLIWGLMTVFGGLCTQYWQLAITRLLMGVASAGCVPFAASIISDYFPTKRGAALGFFNWGVYVGYSFTFLLVIAEKQLGWRAVYYIAGCPAVALAILIWAAVVEPPRHQTDGSENDLPPSTRPESRLASLRYACRHFLDPVLLLLSFGGAIRNGAGFVWAFNIIQFFSEFHPGTNTEDWMTWIPLVFGSIGAFGGGFISDVLSRNRGIAGRLVVLTACCVVSAPFQVGTLLLPMPWAFIVHIPAYLIGEMWIGVCVAIVIDLVPADLTTSAVAIYFFIIQIIGGNMNVLVTPLADSVGYRYALLITFPGFYLIAAAIFLLTLVVFLCMRRKSDTENISSPQAVATENVTIKDVDSSSDDREKPATTSIKRGENDGLQFTNDETTDRSEQVRTNQTPKMEPDLDSPEDDCTKM